MISSRFVVTRLLLLIAFPISLFAQQPDASHETPDAVNTDTARVRDGGAVVPHFMRFSGVVKDAAGTPRTGVVGLTFALYDQNDGGAAIWQETQNVTLDDTGRYNVLLGATKSRGLPMEPFASGEARFIGVRVVEENAVEQPRVRLVSVPYALAAGDAQSLGGRPVTDFALTKAAALASGDAQAAGSPTEVSGAVSSAANTVNKVAKFTALDTVGDSSIFDNGFVGIGTATPSSLLHLNSTGASYLTIGSSGANNLDRGIRFLDQAGNAAGFLITTPNTTGTNSAMNFYVGGATGADIRLSINNNGNVGYGTLNPSSPLHVKGTGTNYIIIDSSGANNLDRGIRFMNQAGVSAGLVALTPNTIGTDSQMYFYVGGAGASDVKLTLQNNGNVGIGTLVPGSRFEVTDSAGTQTAKFSQTSAGVGSFSIGSPPPTAIRGDATAATNVTTAILGTTSSTLGRAVVGESLATTGANMGVFGVAVNSPDGTGVWGEATNTTGDAVGVYGRSTSNSGAGMFGEATATSGDAVGVAGRSAAAGGTGVLGEAVAATGENYGVYGRVIGSNSTAATAGMFINTASGSLLVGRVSTAAQAANVFRVDTAGKGFFNGGTQTGGADFAESVTVRDQVSDYQPGDVIAIDTNGVRRFTKSTSAYSTLVAGIYSTKPGVLATPHTMDDPRIASEEIPLAVVGIVPCKVTNENGTIKVGDLLVSSSRAGYAMKGTDQKRMNGAVIGKALQSMNGTTGVIEVLVSLQ